MCDRLDERTLYSVISEDIRRSKNQQWLIATYGSALLTIITTSQNYLKTVFTNHSDSLVITIISSFLVAGIGFLGIMSFIMLNLDMRDYREITRRIRDRFIETYPDFGELFIRTRRQNWITWMLGLSYGIACNLLIIYFIITTK